MIWTNRRLALALALVALASSLAVLMIVAGHLLDVGDRRDTTSNVTPATLAPQSLPPRVFEVDPAASKVDFTAQVAGVALDGVFPVRGGTITLEPVEQQLQVHVALEIDVDGLATGNAVFDRALRAALASGDYPLAFYVASSEGRVPVTEEPVSFTLTGDLQLHNVMQPHPMRVDAQLTGAHLNAVATSTLNLADHGVALPALLGSPQIELRAEIAAVEASATPDD